MRRRSPNSNSDASASVAAQTVHGSLFSLGSSSVTLVLGLIRAILLARLLLPEHFGVFALAHFFLSLAAQLQVGSLDAALIHRKETPGAVLNTYFTLRTALLMGSMALLAACVPLIQRFYPGSPELGLVLFALIGVNLLRVTNATQEVMLRKELAFRRLAVIDIVSSLTMTIVAPALAWQGWGLWSLVAERVSGQVARTSMVWGVYRLWGPRFGWDRKLGRWFWSYGFTAWKSSALGTLLTRFDDFWVGTALGETLLGFYSRAFEFSRYPRRILVEPLLTVFFPVFARVQDDRLRLSRAFFRVMSVLVRFGGWATLFLIATAHDGIALVLGEKWIPMTRAFQIMGIYTVLTPLTTGGRHVLMAVGRPDLVLRSRMVQMGVFVPAVVGLGYAAGIEGVALASDLMMGIGAVLLMVYAGQYVDYSKRALWLWPTLAMAVAAAGGIALDGLWDDATPWLRLMARGGAVTVLYGGVLLLAEREQLVKGWLMVWGLIRDQLRAMRRTETRGAR